MRTQAPRPTQAAVEEREGELNTGFQLLDPFGIRPSDLKKTLVKVGILEACQVAHEEIFKSGNPEILTCMVLNFEILQIL